MAEILTKEIFNAILAHSSQPKVYREDKIGNRLEVYRDGRVHIVLAREKGRVRKIGYISADTYYTKRVEKHYHQSSKSFGINYLILKETALFNWVCITYQGNHYRIPKDTVTQLGRVLYFKECPNGESFEVQIFFPLAIMRNYKIEFETERKFEDD